MARILERVGAHYEIQELSGGKVYRSCPECVLVECGCGEKVSVTPSMEPCSCGEDYNEAKRELASRGPQAPEPRLTLLEDYYEWKGSHTASYDNTYELELAALD